MTVRPEFGPDGEDVWTTPQVLPRDEDPDVVGEREVTEYEMEDQEVNRLDPEDNEAHVPGGVCPRCGTVISAEQDVRRRADGQWVHEVCPLPAVPG